jgi:serine/threonine-protein kinase
LLASGPLPVDVTLIIGASIARALEHAHFRRVIHRDIKPGNIMVSKHGVVKLTDFGIAKDTRIDDLTQTGLVVGTPSYVAPERITGKTDDPRSDLYSLGVVLFQCIAGERPFRATTTSELFIAIQKGDRQRLRALAPNCPRGVERIVDRCLEVDPEKRYKRASELRQAIDVHLRRALDGTPQARMVSFLYERGLTDTEHLATLDIAAIAELDATIGAKVTEAAKRREAETAGASIEIDVEDAQIGGGRGWLVALGVIVAMAAASGVAWILAPEAVEATLEQAIEWARGLARGLN